MTRDDIESMARIHDRLATNMRHIGRRFAEAGMVRTAMEASENHLAISQNYLGMLERG